MMQVWVLTDDYRCPKCFAPCEMKIEEMEDDDGCWEERRIRCLDCGHVWTMTDDDP